MKQVSKFIFAMALGIVIAGCARPAQTSDQLASSEQVQTSQPASISGPVPAAESSEPATSNIEKPTNLADVPEAATEIVPATPVASPDSGEAVWPPVIIFGDILEAGTSETTLAGFRLQIPAGFTETASTATSQEYTAARPETGRGGSIVLSADSSTGSEAQSQLAAWVDSRAPSSAVRVGTIQVQGTMSAAIAEYREQDRLNWTLGVVTADETFLVITFSAHQDDFDWFLFPQSLGSVRAQ